MEMVFDVALDVFQNPNYNDDTDLPNKNKFTSHCHHFPFTRHRGFKELLLVYLRADSKGLYNLHGY